MDLVFPGAGGKIIKKRRLWVPGHFSEAAAEHVGGKDNDPDAVVRRQQGPHGLTGPSGVQRHMILDLPAERLHGQAGDRVSQ